MWGKRPLLLNEGYKLKYGVVLNWKPMELVEYMENSKITAGFSSLTIQQSGEACQAL